MRNDSKFLKIILLLAFAGVLISGWLLSTHIKLAAGQAGLTEGCLAFTGTAGAGCEKVALSGYSYLFGVIPLAAVALGYYLALLLLVFWGWKSPQTAYEPLYVSFNLATLSIVVTVIMFSISRFILQEFCVGCAMLWLINLSIWPALVKHLGLNWGNALAANLETFRPKDLQLKSERVRRGYVLTAGFVLALSVIGVAAKALNTQANMFGGAERGVEEFRVAQRVFLPPEAFGGAASKGLTSGAKAPVLDIVKFSDFQCPACRMAAQNLKPFVIKYSDKVRLTYRNFPLDGSCNPYAPNGGHRAACVMALAVICAGEQGKFFDLHDQIFDRQQELQPDLLGELAQKAGLDKTKLDQCMASPGARTQLDREMSWGDSVGLQSTPTLIINGRRLSGALAPAQLEALLKAVESGNTESHGSH